VTLVFTDIVGSTQLKRAQDDREGVAIIQHHHAVVRDLLRQFKEGEEISSTGDSFFIVFVKPSDAVRSALLLQVRNRAFAAMRGSRRCEEAHSEKAEFRIPRLK